MEYLVSVIIPVYNVLPYLEEALKSVVSQTYSNIEIIIIDDGSTDGSGDICDEYAEKDRRVHLIHQENKGLSAARNVGLDIMKGDYVVFLDPDDAYHSNYIMTLLSYIVKLDVDIVVCKYCRQDTDYKLSFNTNQPLLPKIEVGVYKRKESLRARADGTLNPNVWNKIYKSDIWDNIRFPVGRVYEDIATMYQVFDRCEKTYVCEDVLYVRRIRTGSITSSVSLKNRIDCMWALLQFEDYIKTNIPSIFDQYHLERIQKLRLNLLIYSYTLFYTERNACNLISLIELRDQIKELGKNVGISGHDFPIQIAYYLILYFPFLLPIAHPIYHRIKSIQRKVIVTFRT